MLKTNVNKGILMILVFVMALLLIPHSSIKAISDEEFASNESYYAGLCNGYVVSSANRKTCEEYKGYLIRKRDSSNNTASQMQKDIAALGTNIDAIKEESKRLSARIEEIRNTIIVIEETLPQIELGIQEAQVKIDKKELDIAARKEVIKERMVNLQVKVNTNQYVDYIMGATDLVDMIKRSSNLERFTMADNELIELLNVEMKKLAEEKQEQERLKESQELQKERLESSRKEAEELYQYNLQLAGIYESQQAELIAQKNEAIRQANIASGNIEQIVFEKEEDLPPPSTSGMIRPINGPTSAGTWYYPASFGGGVHLGIDKAVPIGTGIYAPANGVVLKSSTATSASDGGTLGSTLGFPYGGGNTLHILVNVNGQPYAVSFFHNSPNILSTGQSISQGQLIGYTGNTGNSSGQHCHIEVMKINLSYADAIAYWNRNNDWAWGTGWSVGGACSGVACRIRPESLGW